MLSACPGPALWREGEQSKLRAAGGSLTRGASTDLLVLTRGCTRPTASGGGRWPLPSGSCEPGPALSADVALLSGNRCLFRNQLK